MMNSKKKKSLFIAAAVLVLLLGGLIYYMNLDRYEDYTKLAKDLPNNHMEVSAQITKGNRSRTVPLTDKAIEVLNQIPRHIHGKVFPMSLNYHNKGWRALIKRAGIVGLRWHDLRREATSRLNLFLYFSFNWIFC